MAQGEGARDYGNSHFEKFTRMKESFEKLVEKNHAFQPGRPGARNPVMRQPLAMEGRVWITDAPAVRYLDLGNAIYSLMLRFLLQLYSMESRSAQARKVLLEGAFSLMHGIGAIGSILSQLTASSGLTDVNAGLSFDLTCYFNPIELSCENRLLTERLNEILAALQDLQNHVQFPPHVSSLEEVLSTIIQIRNSLKATDLADGV